MLCGQEEEREKRIEMGKTSAVALLKKELQTDTLPAGLISRTTPS